MKKLNKFIWNLHPLSKYLIYYVYFFLFFEAANIIFAFEIDTLKNIFISFVLALLFTFIFSRKRKWQKGKA